MEKAFNSAENSGSPGGLKIFDIMISKENNFAFIDSNNLNLGIQSMGWKLDFAKFRRYLKEKLEYKDIRQKMKKRR